MPSTMTSLTDADVKAHSPQCPTCGQAFPLDDDFLQSRIQDLSLQKAPLEEAVKQAETQLVYSRAAQASAREAADRIAHGEAQAQQLRQQHRVLLLELETGEQALVQAKEALTAAQGQALNAESAANQAREAVEAQQNSQHALRAQAHLAQQQQQRREGVLRQQALDVQVT
jgi:hypothetical protein